MKKIIFDAFQDESRRDDKKINEVISNLIHNGCRCEIKGSDLILSNGRVLFVFEKFREVITFSNLELVEESRRKSRSNKGGKHLAPEVNQPRFIEDFLDNIRNSSALRKVVSISAMLAIVVCATSITLTNIDTIDTESKSEDETPTSGYEQIIDYKDLPNVVIDRLETVGTNLAPHGYNKPSISERSIIREDSIGTLIPEVEVQEPVISYEEKSHTVREREILTKAMLNDLLTSMCVENPFGIMFENEDAALDHLYENQERTYEEKMLIIMAREGLSYNELDSILAGCVAEGGDYYDETYRVASTIHNRSHNIPYINENGTSYYAQFVAKNQFSVYASGFYKDFLGCIDLAGYQGAIDMFYSRVTSHNYIQFRGSFVDLDFKYEQFQSNGNKYFSVMKESDRVESDYMETINQELTEDLKPQNETGMILAKSNNEAITIN